jgi:hypothetical protein
MRTHAVTLTVHRKYMIHKHFSLACCSAAERMWCSEDTMADYSHILFHKSPLQLRLLGAHGGKVHGRNQRIRRALLPPPPAAVPLRAAPRQTAAESIAVLDARFPWLRRAEKPLGAPRVEVPAGLGTVRMQDRQTEKRAM